MLSTTLTKLWTKNKNYYQPIQCKSKSDLKKVYCILAAIDEWPITFQIEGLLLARSAAMVFHFLKRNKG